MPSVNSPPSARHSHGQTKTLAATTNCKNLAIVPVVTIRYPWVPYSGGLPECNRERSPLFSISSLFGLDWPFDCPVLCRVKKTLSAGPSLFNSQIGQSGIIIGHGAQITRPTEHFTPVLLQGDTAACWGGRATALSLFGLSTR